MAEVAQILGIQDVQGLDVILTFAEGDRVRAWKFAVTFAKIGFCPVAMARSILNEGQKVGLF